MRIKILQADINTAYKFMSFDFAMANGFSLLDYKTVFDGDVEAKGLEDIYIMFNNEHPNNMHSLSMSDIVITEKGMFYCDMVGWQNVLKKTF